MLSQPDLRTWDFFIAHAGPDRAAAVELHRLLTAANGATAFLDAKDLAPGDAWDEVLPWALSRARVTIVLVSPHTERAHYQQEEIAIAIALARETAHRVVPVYLPGADPRKPPYGLRRINHLTVADSDLGPVAGDLLALLRTPPPERPASVRLARATHALDEMWAIAEPVMTGGTSGVHRLRFGSDGDDMVVRHRDGTELQRITRAEFESRLDPDRLGYVEILEKSMDVHTKIWKRDYPQRTAGPTQEESVRKAVRALAQDLLAVLEMLEQAGFWLDDHYMMARHIASDALA